MSAEEPEPDDDGDPAVPSYGTAPKPVGMREGRTRAERFLHFVATKLHIVAGVAAGVVVVAALVLDIQLSRSQAIVAASFAVGLVVFGWPTGRKAAGLLGGPQLVWLVDVDLLDREGASIVTIPSPRWRDEWEVTKDELWWATPELAFGKRVDLEEKTVEGVWPGTLPEPVLMRCLAYLSYNREILQEKARAGELVEMNAHALIREATIEETGQLVRLFEQGTLPDNNEAFLSAVDDVLEEHGLEDELYRPENDATPDTEPSGDESDGEASDGFHFVAAPQGGEDDG